jgi:biopolymer transport protein ExbD
VSDFESISETSQIPTADMTPLMDTIFLIILLLLATLMNSSIVRGFPVNLPVFSEKTTIQKESDSVEVSIDKDGFIYIGKEKIDLPNIAGAIQTATTQSQAKKVLLRADSAVTYGRVAQVLCHVSNCQPDKQVILVTQDDYSEGGKSDSLSKKGADK